MELRENITGIDGSIYASQKGYGNQLIACGILVKLGYEAMLAETGNSFYDLIVILRDNNNVEFPVKTGVRTLTTSLNFKVNQGGGVNRPRPVGGGANIPTLDDIQLWVGITNDFDLYYFPHRLIINKQHSYRGAWLPIGSISKNKLSHTRNNTEILDNFFNDTWMNNNVLNQIPDSNGWRTIRP